MIQRMLAIWSQVPLPFPKTSLNIRKFTVHILLKPGLENFEHYFTSVRDECNCCGGFSILWHCLSLGLEWKLTFSSPVATGEFSKFAGILSTALSQHHLLGFEIAKGSSTYHKRLLSINKLSTPPRSPIYMKTSGFLEFLLNFSLWIIHKSVLFVLWRFGFIKM